MFMRSRRIQMHSSENKVRARKSCQVINPFYSVFLLKFLLVCLSLIQLLSKKTGITTNQRTFGPSKFILRTNQFFYISANKSN